jgi:tRNA-specific 2-thiouridylase
VVKKVVIGLSGGVDSSVAAHLLKQEGYEVIGLFMKNWHDESVTILNECPWLEDSNDALLVSQKLGIPFQTIDLSEPYQHRIIDYMFREYEQGRTPNPDVLCNREIKFDIFLDTALKLGADFIATGHYSRIEKLERNGRVIYRLLSGIDRNKDQSYFLCQLSQYQLSKSLFPIGDLTKAQVRKIAQDLHLPTANKKDSQGLCFVGKVRLPEFLMQKLQPKKGDIIEIPKNSVAVKKPAEIHSTEVVHNYSLQELTRAPVYHPEDGEKVGEHRGAHFFTIGQRKGLNVGGTPEPLFVIGIDTKRNIIYTGQGEKHPGLYRRGLFVTNSNIHWIREDIKLKTGKKMRVLARIRYRQALEPSIIYQEPEGLYVVFDRPQKGITPGQFVAWYREDELLGSGIIN